MAVAALIRKLSRKNTRIKVGDILSNGFVSALDADIMVREFVLNYFCGLSQGFFGCRGVGWWNWSEVY